jgi:hypothetical protein
VLYHTTSTLQVRGLLQPTHNKFAPSLTNNHMHSRITLPTQVRDLLHTSQKVFKRTERISETRVEVAGTKVHLNIVMRC